MNKWYNLQEKTPESGTVCMVAYEYRFNNDVFTHYARAVWFNRNDNIKVNDGSIEIIPRNGFYVAIDPRPLKLHFAMLTPHDHTVVAWQENNAPYIQKPFESWEFELIKCKEEFVENERSQRRI